jgi:hypothetical protein
MPEGVHRPWLEKSGWAGWLAMKSRVVLGARNRQRLLDLTNQADGSTSADFT